MLNKFENYNINKFTETLQKFIVNDGYRILSVQSSNGGQTEVIVLTKVEDLTQLNYKIRLLFKKHDRIDIDNKQYYAWNANKITISYIDTRINDSHYGFWDNAYELLDKTILSETYKYENHFFENKTDFYEYIENSLII
jgi:hypothetical protein